MWEYEIFIASGGSSLYWFIEKFCEEYIREVKKSKKSTFDLLLNKASKVKVGSDGLLFYPFYSGMTEDSKNNYRGIFYGITLNHGKEHFARAILEGVALNYLDRFKFLNNLGLNPVSVSMVGGETKSELWNQIKSDVLGRSILIPEVDDAAALGAALLSGIGVGLYFDYKKAIRETVRPKKEYLPNKKKHKKYSAIFNIYRSILNSL